MVGPDDEAQKVRRHDADESDHAGNRHASAHAERDEDDDASPKPLDVNAEVRGFGLAEDERVDKEISFGKLPSNMKVNFNIGRRKLIDQAERVNTFSAQTTGRGLRGAA